MKSNLVLALSLSMLPLTVLADKKIESGEKVDEVVNEVCPVSGKAIDPTVTTKYEERTYGFCCKKCCGKWVGELKSSLYHQVGGKAAIDAAVNLFYTKVLADERVNFHFEDMNRHTHWLNWSSFK